jgi:Fe-Mn family superoxide dismutase
MKQLERKIELLETILEGKNIFEANYKAQKLDYNPNSLSDFIDKETMDVHYNGHYKTYIKKLNDLLPDDKTIPIEVLIKKISRYNRKVRNNAGGVYNHQLFWKMLSPNKTKPSEELLDKIIKDFGSYDDFRKKFERVAQDKFGSGWVWLVVGSNGKLRVTSTSNQDNPEMNNIRGGGKVLLGLDIWEHAYYLSYRNKRDQYIKNFWKVVNWDFVNSEYQKLKPNKK